MCMFCRSLFFPSLLAIALSFIDLRILIPLWYRQTLPIVYITICHAIFLRIQWRLFFFFLNRSRLDLTDRGTFMNCTKVCFFFIVMIQFYCRILKSITDCGHACSVFSFRNAPAVRDDTTHN